MLRSLAVGLSVSAAALVLATGAAAALSLALGAGPTFTLTLDGSDKTATASFTMTVTNTGATGTLGWNITASQTPLTSGSNSLGYATVTGVTASACSGGGCADPTNSVTFPIALSGTAVKIYNAALNTGRGTNPLTANLSLGVPGNAFAGSYTSTMTLSIASGP